MGLVLILFPLHPGLAQAGAHEHKATAALYQIHCASCHGAQRYGGYAPPLIPETLKRRKNEELEKVILKGRPQTQMAPFSKVITPAQAAALVRYIRTPVGEIRWELEQVTASRQEPPPVEKAYTPPAHPERVVLVVERGRSRIVVLDGDSLSELDAYEVGQIHGGPKFTDDYGLIFSTTRDGTLVRYNLRTGQVEARVKVAVNTRNIAVSPDGKWVAAANQLPQSLVLMDGMLRPRAVFPLKGAPSAVYQIPGEAAFVLTLRTAAQMIRVDYPALKAHTTELPQVFEDFTFVPGRKQALASSRGGKQILLYDMQAHMVLHTLDTTGLPHLFSATYFMRGGALHAALNHIGVPSLSVVNMDTFTLVKQFKLQGAGYFVRTHPGTPYLWADTNTDTLQLVDKASLTLQAEALVPEPGKKAMHVEFTADGKKAMLSLWHPKGALVVYDSATLAEEKRIPFNMPIGKYNALNKTHFPLE